MWPQIVDIHIIFVSFEAAIVIVFSNTFMGLISSTSEGLSPPFHEVENDIMELPLHGVVMSLTHSVKPPSKRSKIVVQIN